VCLGKVAAVGVRGEAGELVQQVLKEASASHGLLAAASLETVLQSCGSVCVCVCVC
jgi:hypothetical protein